jgi:Tfp pilus assembly protein PilV
LEAVISIFILSAGIVAVMSLVASSLRQAISAKDHQIAVLLAEEGIELVRNLRDNNWTTGSGAASTFDHTHPGSPPDDDFPSADKKNCFLDDRSSFLKCNNAANQSCLAWTMDIIGMSQALLIPRNFTG